MANPALTLDTAAATLPLGLDLVKEHLRVTITNDDNYITTLIAAATDYTEKYLGRALITQTWIAKYDGFPAIVYLPYAPLQSVSSIAYLDTAGDSQTLSSSLYQTDTASTPPRVMPAYGQVWPSTYDSFNAVTITYVAGYGATDEDIPVTIKHALLLLIGHLYENRENSTPGTVNAVPMGYDALLSTYRMPPI